MKDTSQPEPEVDDFREWAEVAFHQRMQVEAQVRQFGAVSVVARSADEVGLTDAVFDLTEAGFSPLLDEAVTGLHALGRGDAGSILEEARHQHASSRQDAFGQGLSPVQERAHQDLNERWSEAISGEFVERTARQLMSRAKGWTPR